MEEKTLIQLRKNIDSIDDQLLKLIIQRSSIVEKIGAVKESSDKVVDKTNGNVYIGSTICTLNTRLCKHINDYRMSQRGIDRNNRKVIPKVNQIDNTQQIHPEPIMIEPKSRVLN